MRPILNSTLITALCFLLACAPKTKNENELWIYTSMYKDTISIITEKLKKDFPDHSFHWFQAGSEEIATKVNAEIIATGKTKADVLISSDRFWYEEMASNGKLLSYKAQNSEKIPNTLKHPQAFYATVSIPVMVMTYNGEVFNEKTRPKTFKEMAEGKWKNQFTTGSPLASGTNFTTVAMLVDRYGWDYVKALRNNDTISQGGNSAVLRRVQSKERSVGWVLLENLLRFQDKDKRLKLVLPDDGVVIQSNVMALVKKDGDQKLAKSFADWMLKTEGQEAMLQAYMYAPTLPNRAPKGAPPLQKLLDRSFPWTREFIQKTVSKREEIKERFAKIMFE